MQGKTFEERVKKGLKDADYEYPWQGDHIIGDTYTWHDHFYNPGPEPNRERNYRGEASSAVTEGRRYFNLSIHAAMRALHYKRAGRVPPGLYDEAAYYLGLSLHFLTDLTPMHSANFTNGLGENTHRPRPRAAVVEAGIAMVENLGLSFNGPPALSPDGKVLAYLGRDLNGRQTIWLRARDRSNTSTLAGAPRRSPADHRPPRDVSKSARCSR